jgi:thiol-disulfide isomerase/thioredoxin
MSYVRFSDNSTQSNNSYKMFNDEQQNQVLEQHKQSPQELQQQQEQFQQQSPQSFQQQSRQQIHSQTPLPPTDEEFKNKQLELRQKQQQMQQQRYQTSISQNQESDQVEPKRVENYSNMSVSDIHQKFPNSNEIYINEIHRLLQNEQTLTIDQASNIAQGNGCGVSGYNDMCPSRPIESPKIVETFKQKGDCVGEDCDVTFSTNKKEKYESSISDKLKDLDITFYTNSGCGFCKQTMNLIENVGGDLKNSITTSTNLPKGVRGFPHFVSGKSGKTHTGFPGTLERLHSLLS